MLNRLKNLWKLSEYSPTENKAIGKTVLMKESKPKKKLASFVEMEEPLSEFNEES